MYRLLDVLLPPVCAGCGAEGSAPCTECSRQIGRRLGEPVAVPLGLADMMPGGVVQLEWCSAFTGPARAAIHALKYDGERRLAAPLGELMARRWAEAGVGGDVLVPVPVHVDRRRERGFDQAELLARVIGQRLGLPVVAGVRRVSRTVAQHGLGRGARAGNVGRAFVADPRLAGAIGGRWPILVDDVVTTGATLAGCAVALHAAGARAVSALTLARER